MLATRLLEYCKSNFSLSLQPNMLVVDMEKFVSPKSGNYGYILHMQTRMYLRILIRTLYTYFLTLVFHEEQTLTCWA